MEINLYFEDDPLASRNYWLTGRAAERLIFHGSDQLLTRSYGPKIGESFEFDFLLFEKKNKK
jgi:hypothetical protein